MLYPRRWLPMASILSSSAHPFPPPSPPPPLSSAHERTILYNVCTQFYSVDRARTNSSLHCGDFQQFFPWNSLSPPWNKTQFNCLLIHSTWITQEIINCLLIEINRINMATLDWIKYAWWGLLHYLLSWPKKECFLLLHSHSYNPLFVHWFSVDVLLFSLLGTYRISLHSLL